MRSGVLVKKRSRVLEILMSVLVASKIIRDRPLSFMVARRRLHCCKFLAAGDGAPTPQSIPGKLKSPANHTCAFVLTMLLSVLDRSSK